MQFQAERIHDLSPAVVGRAVRALYGFSTYTADSGLEESLLELVRMRASQINGCAACLDMHTKEARARGESEQRLYLLTAWREVPFYSERERAALAWTEAVTLIADGNVPDAVYEEARKVFSEEELLNLTMAVIIINGWNRLNVSLRTVPNYEPAAAAQVLAELGVAL